MPSTDLQASVIIPTVNRADSLRRLLTALAKQDRPLHLFEVIVVVDGDHRGALEFLAQYGGPLQLSFQRQAPAGPAVARNTGAKRANAPRLIFLDDDVEPVPGLVSAHLEAGAPQVLCLGRLATEFPLPLTILAAGMLDWWETKLHEVRQPGHRFEYTDMLSANFSIATSAFNDLGGFDNSFKCREDYEFGARALKAGLRFVYSYRAAATHWERPDPIKLLARSRAEGVGDVQMARKHPELIPWLKLAHLKPASPALARLPRRLRGPLRRRLTYWEKPPLRPGAWLRLLYYTYHRGRLWKTRQQLPLLEKLNARVGWRTRFAKLFADEYLQGVKSACPRFSQLKQLLDSAPPAVAPASCADLRDGLPALAAALSAAPCQALECAYGGIRIGALRPKGIAEPLRPETVRRELRATFPWELALARTWDEVIGQRPAKARQKPRRLEVPPAQV